VLPTELCVDPSEPEPISIFYKDFQVVILRGGAAWASEDRGSYLLLKNTTKNLTYEKARGVPLIPTWQLSHSLDSNDPLTFTLSPLNGVAQKWLETKGWLVCSEFPVTTGKEDSPANRSPGAARNTLQPTQESVSGPGDFTCGRGKESGDPDVWERNRWLQKQLEDQRKDNKEIYKKVDSIIGQLGLSSAETDNSSVMDRLDEIEGEVKRARAIAEQSFARAALEKRRGGASLTDEAMPSGSRSDYSGTEDRGSDQTQISLVSYHAVSTARTGNVDGVGDADDADDDGCSPPIVHPGVSSRLPLSTLIEKLGSQLVRAMTSMNAAEERVKRIHELERECSEAKEKVSTLQQEKQQLTTTKIAAEQSLGQLQTSLRETKSQLAQAQDAILYTCYKVFDAVGVEAAQNLQCSAELGGQTLQRVLSVESLPDKLREQIPDVITAVSQALRQWDSGQQYLSTLCGAFQKAVKALKQARERGAPADDIIKARIEENFKGLCERDGMSRAITDVLTEKFVKPAVGRALTSVGSPAIKGGRPSSARARAGHGGASSWRTPSSLYGGY